MQSQVGEEKGRRSPTSRTGGQNAKVIEIYDLLLRWDLAIPKKYMVERSLYRAEEINQVEQEYKRFLALTVAYPDRKVPMAAKVDEFWHGHILFTEDYGRMCHAVFGTFLHHRPCILDGGIEALDPHFRTNTLPLYTEHFGEPNPAWWCQGAQVCVGNDGTCHGDL